MILYIISGPAHLTSSTLDFDQMIPLDRPSLGEPGAGGRWGTSFKANTYFVARDLMCGSSNYDYAQFRSNSISADISVAVSNPRRGTSSKKPFHRWCETVFVSYGVHLKVKWITQLTWMLSDFLTFRRSSIFLPRSHPKHVLRIRTPTNLVAMLIVEKLKQPSLSPEDNQSLDTRFPARAENSFYPG